MKYRKRPVEVEAIQYRPHENCAEVAEFVGQDHPEDCGGADKDVPYSMLTPVGLMEAQPGEYIVKFEGVVMGPMAAEPFEAEYEPVEEGVPA